MKKKSKNMKVKKKYVTVLLEIGLMTDVIMESLTDDPFMDDGYVDVDSWFD